MAMMAQQTQMEFQQAQTAALQGQASEFKARAGKLAVETQLAPQELEIDKINAITKNLKEGDEDDKEFERRLKIANIALKEKTLNSQSSKGEPSRANDTDRNQQIPRPNQPSVQQPPRQIGLAGEPGQGTRGPTQ